MIRKSGYRFSEKIMLKQKDRAGRRFEEKSSRSERASKDIAKKAGQDPADPDTIRNTVLGSATSRRSSGSDVSVCRITGTSSRQMRPSERQSNKASPPSCDSMLAITLRVPNPRDFGL